MSRMLQDIPLNFQRPPFTPGGSMQHKRDIRGYGTRQKAPDPPSPNDGPGLATTHRFGGAS
jgi:hypothetical protein